MRSLFAVGSVSLFVLFAAASGALPLPVLEDVTVASYAPTTNYNSNTYQGGLFVYNAGSNREPRSFLDTPIEDVLFLEHLNCRGPLLLAHHFGARLRERQRGGMILMSSLASLCGSHYQATYAATKAFDTVLAEGLWHELAPEGVDVLGVLAGATRTPTMLAGKGKFDDAMDPAEVAAGALDHLGKGPNWVAGAANQAIARSVWPIPRVGLVNAISRAGAEIFGLPHAQVDGVEFHES